MDLRIWKYELAVTDRQDIEMPERAELLSVGSQRESVCLWAMVDASIDRRKTRTIEIIGTGNPVYQDMGVGRTFIGTVIDEPFVWHVFERTS